MRLFFVFKNFCTFESKKFLAMKDNTASIKEKLIINTLTFDYPKESIIFYFSDTNDTCRKSAILKWASHIPMELQSKKKYSKLLEKKDGFKIYTSFDMPMDGFDPVAIDFNDPGNRYFVKLYYNHCLEKYFEKIHDVVITKSGITHDLQIWLYTHQVKEQVTYFDRKYDLVEMDRFTLKVKYDTLSHRPYILVANDRPALLLNIPLSRLFEAVPNKPFEDVNRISPSMINKVMTIREYKKNDGSVSEVRKIDKYENLQKNNQYCPAESTLPLMSGDLIRYFGLDRHMEGPSFESKYVKYKQKIDTFRQTYLNNQEIENIFKHLAHSFTSVNLLQVGQISHEKRMLVFGNDKYGHTIKNNRQQMGINYGPRIKCNFKDVRLIAIYHEDDKELASYLLMYLKLGNYKLGENGNPKPLGKFIGTNVNYPNKNLHIEFSDRQNPVKEITEALNGEAYRNLDPQIKYIGIYVSPIHKYTGNKASKECYYKIKELFLKHGISTQCIDVGGMKKQQETDKHSGSRNFIYTLQNMSVAICAKLGGSPWLLDEAGKKELIIGIGAFQSDNQQYIGAAFSFDNTGVFNHYNYFQKSEMGELIGAIKMQIISYSSVNTRPNRLIIHYYKKISRKKEFNKLEEMLHSLQLDIPVYIVTINKTESEDIVLFDENSRYVDRKQNTILSLMPYSGTWVNLGPTREGYRYLLCNNTRYEGENFNSMDGFPFPVKLTIACPNNNNEIETHVIEELISQVYQFSRIYWKSVKQQGLPVTIKYPEMIAEIMPHFSDPTVYVENRCLWFL